MVQQLDHHGVQTLVERGAQLVDVMPAGAYRNTHLKNAVNLPLTRLDQKTAQNRLDRSRPVIVYCADYQ